MGRSATYLLVVALGFAAALSLASCGEEDAQLLPGTTAREIIANLDAVKQLANEGDCLGAESAALQVSEQIEALTGVDEKLKQALRDGVARLNEVVDSCEESTTEAVGPASIPTETEETTGKPPKDKEKKEKPEKDEATKTPPPEPTTPPEPPEREEEEETGGEEGEDESPSGGVGPGSPVEGEE